MVSNLPAVLVEPAPAPPMGPSAAADASEPADSDAEQLVALGRVADVLAARGMPAGEIAAVCRLLAAPEEAALAPPAPVPRLPVELLGLVAESVFKLTFKRRDVLNLALVSRDARDAAIPVLYRSFAMEGCLTGRKTPDVIRSIAADPSRGRLIQNLTAYGNGNAAYMAASAELIRSAPKLKSLETDLPFEVLGPLLPGIPLLESLSISADSADDDSADDEPSPETVIAPVDLKRLKRSVRSSLKRLKHLQLDRDSPNDLHRVLDGVRSIRTVNLDGGADLRGCGHLARKIGTFHFWQGGDLGSLADVEGVRIAMLRISTRCSSFGARDLEALCQFRVRQVDWEFEGHASEIVAVFGALPAGVKKITLRRCGRREVDLWSLEQLEAAVAMLKQQGTKIKVSWADSVCQQEKDLWRRVLAA